jgi:nucleoside-diphosphate-sugar epimerase
MKVIVTGSRGFLGTELVKHLKRNKHTVVECDIILRHDITDFDCMEKLFDAHKNADACVHLAAVSNLDIYDTDAEKGLDVNLAGTKNLIDLCKKHSIKMYFASTCCLYGNNGVPIITEQSKISPTEDYARSKEEGEALINAHNKSNDLKFISMRFATFYGGKYARGALCISKFIKQCIDKDTLQIHGSGSMSRTYTHVIDMVTGIDALLTAGQSGKLLHDLYNVTDSNSYSVWDIVHEVSKNIDEQEFSVKFVENRDVPFSQGIIKSDRLRGLGWRPKYTWSTGVTEAVNAYRANGKWLK